MHIIPKAWRKRAYMFGVQIPKITQIKKRTRTYFYAKNNCKHCYGRGFVGKDQSGKPVPCRCLLRQIARYNQLNVELTAVNPIQVRFQDPKEESD